MDDDQLARWERTGISRLTRKFGHRACFIWLMSMAWGINGIIVGVGDHPPVEHLFHTYLPTPIRVALWVFPAAIATSVARSHYEWLAFVVLGLPPAQRLASYWVGSALVWADNRDWWLTWELIGRGFIWLVVLLLMWLVATWPNAVEIELVEDDEAGE